MEIMPSTSNANQSPLLPPEASLIHLLVVDDNESLRHLIKKSLARRGFLVTAVAGAREALALCRDAPPDLIASDWCLGRNSLSGIDILKALRSREETKNIPFIMMSSIKESPEDEALVRCLGGDLFLTKSEIINSGQLGEAFARHVHALVLRRRQPSFDGAPTQRQGNGQARRDGLELDQSNHSVCFNGKSCKLPDGLFDLFCLLASRRPHALERSDLADRIVQDCRDREVDVRISRLRAKLEEAFGLDPIETVLGIGYRLNMPSPARDSRDEDPAQPVP